MKILMRRLFSVIAAYALLALASANVWSQTTCELVRSLTDLAATGEFIDLKTDFSDSDCTTQVTVKVDKVSPDVTKVDFKIDRTCSSTGQAQFLGIAIDVSGSPPITSCNVNYDNPADSTQVGEDTLIADVPAFQQLIVDAAEATAMQFPSGNTTADSLVSILKPCPCNEDTIEHAALWLNVAPSGTFIVNGTETSGRIQINIDDGQGGTLCASVPVMVFVRSVSNFQDPNQFTNFFCRSENVDLPVSYENTDGPQPRFDFLPLQKFALCKAQVKDIYGL